MDMASVSVASVALGLTAGARSHPFAMRIISSVIATAICPVINIQAYPISNHVYIFVANDTSGGPVDDAANYQRTDRAQEVVGGHEEAVGYPEAPPRYYRAIWFVCTNYGMSGHIEE